MYETYRLNFCLCEGIEGAIKVGLILLYETPAANWVLLAILRPKLGDRIA